MSTTVLTKALAQLVDAPAADISVTALLKALAQAAETIPEDDLDGGLSIAAFCQTYGVSRSAAYKEIKSGRLRIMKVGSRSIINHRSRREWERVCEALAAEQANAEQEAAAERKPA